MVNLKINGIPVQAEEAPLLLRLHDRLILTFRLSAILKI